MRIKALFSLCRRQFANDRDASLLAIALGLVLLQYEADVHHLIDLSPMSALRHHVECLEMADTCARTIEVRLEYGLHTLFPFSYEKVGQDPEIFAFICDVFDCLAQNGDESIPFAQIVDNMLQIASSREKRGRDSVTPDALAALVVKLVSPSSEMTLYDPCCGYANCLKTAALTCRCRVAGQELNPIVRAVAMMNLVIHGIDAHDIWLGDVFSNPQNILDGKLVRYDAVLVNPGFWAPSWNQNIIDATPGAVGKMTPDMDPWHRFDDGVPSASKFDYAFFHHAIRCVQYNGIIVSIFPMGTLFRSSVEAKSRMRWLEAGLLDAVIKLPARLYDVTPEPVCIVIMRLGLLPRDVYFVDASALGSPDVGSKTRHTMTPEAIEKIVSAYRARVDLPKFGRNVSLAEIRQNEYNLNVSRYMGLGETDNVLDQEAIEEEIFYIESRLDVIREEMDKLAEKFDATWQCGENKR